MVLSGDDNGCLKLWDIRNFNCLQTIDLGHKTSMNTLLNLETTIFWVLGLAIS